MESKVSRLVDQYELDSIAIELERAWTSTGREHRSLRDLADFFNQRLLEHRLANEGDQLIGKEVEVLYNTLMGNEGNEADRVRARRRIEQQGIDSKELRDEFVSYQTIRRYLKNYRGVQYKPEETELRDKTRETLQQLRGRGEAVSTDKFESLRDDDRFTLGEFRVSVEFRVYCEDCKAQYSATELLDKNGCECR